jgi:AAA domain
LRGTVKTIRIVSLPDLPDKGDVSDWLDANPRRAEKFVDVCFDVPVWAPDEAVGDRPNRQIASAVGVSHHTVQRVRDEAGSSPTVTTNSTGLPEAAIDAEDANELPPLPFINITAWQAATAPEREWVVRDRVPSKNVTLLSGEGGVGKSILALHLAVATTLGSVLCRRPARRSLWPARMTPTSCTAGLIE